MLALSAMATSEDQMQVVDEQFREFHKVFFDPHQSRRWSVFAGVRFPAPSDNLFTEAAKKLSFSKPVLETEDNTDCYSIHEAQASESAEQPDIVKSVESSELVPLPTSPDIVPEMLTRQLSEPSHNQKVSLIPSLQQSISYDDQIVSSSAAKVDRHVSDPVTLRRLSSAYGSQDQSLLTLNRHEDEDDGGLNREDDEQAVFMTPPNTLSLSSRIMTIESVPDDAESTLLLSAKSQLSHSSSSSLMFNLKAAELRHKSDTTNRLPTTNIPTVVAGYQLTDDDEFESVCVTCTEESFVTAADGLEQEQLTPISVQQPVTFQELYAVIAELEKQLIHQLLTALLRENSSPEFVLIVAEALFQPVSEAAIGNCLYPVFYHLSSSSSSS